MIDRSELEQLAREMCAADGNKPDIRVTRFQPRHGHGLLSAYRILDDDIDGHLSGVCSAWEVYQPVAKYALKNLKGTA